jgi:hypothetical protein
MNRRTRNKKECTIGIQAVNSRSVETRIEVKQKYLHVDNKRSILTMIAVMTEFWTIISDPFMIVAVIVTVLKARQKVDTWL